MKSYEDFLVKYDAEDNSRTATIFKNKKKNLLDIAQINRNIKKSKKLKRVFSIVMLTVIIIAFLFWGIQDKFVGGGIALRCFFGGVVVLWSVLICFWSHEDKLNKDLDLYTLSLYSASKYKTERLLCRQIISYLESKDEK